MVAIFLSIIIAIFVVYISCVRLVIWTIDNNKECKISYEDAFNPMKWKSFVVGTLKSYIIPKHELEQLIIHRYTNIGCQPCLEKGCCLNCGCNTYAKMLDGNAACSGGYWDTYMSEKQWNEWKEIYKPEIKIEIKNG